MYSETVLRHFQQPHNLGAMPDADAVGQAGAPGEGPYLAMYLKVREGRIAAASFATYGCPSAIACGSWVTQWVEGRTLEQASVLDAESLMTVLGGLPLGKEHAAQLAITALRRGLEQAEAGGYEEAEKEQVA